MAKEQEVRTHPVRVRIREVVYRVLERDVLGNPKIRTRSGFGPGMPQIDPAGMGLDQESQEYKNAVEDYKYGQLIYILDDDYPRFTKYDSVIDADRTEELEVAEEELLDIDSASVDQLAEWIEQEKPTVQDVVDASGGEPEYATKLLEAESKAHEGDPRKGVLEGLSAVISRG